MTHDTTADGRFAFTTQVCIYHHYTLCVIVLHTNYMVINYVMVLM
jgi:hypothetical protein